MLKFLKNRMKERIIFSNMYTDKESDERKQLINEYLDNDNLLKLKKELKKIQDSNINYIVETLPAVSKTLIKDTEETKKKKLLKDARRVKKEIKKRENVSKRIKNKIEKKASKFLFKNAKRVSRPKEILSNATNRY